MRKTINPFTRILAYSWLNRDAKLLILASSIQAFGQGFLSVALAVYLADLGLSLIQIGAYFTVGAGGVAFFAFGTAFVSERFGRKALLILLTASSSLAFFALIMTDSILLLALFAFMGALSGAQGGEISATQPLIHASLAETSQPTKRTNVFALFRISTTAVRALGALSAGIPALLDRTTGLDEVAAFKTMLTALIGSLFVMIALYSALSKAPSPRARHWTNPFTLPSRGRIFLLSGLFSIDAFGSALIIHSLAAYWFYTRFQVDLASLSLVFFASELLTAASMRLAAKLANRFGLLNTMVFTHIPANLLLIAVALSPWGWLAIALWLVRAVFGQMDMPARDSYIMTIVKRDERVSMASMEQLGRSTANVAGPSVSTYIWAAFSATTPLISAGVVKIAYDLTLWVMFRGVEPPIEPTSGARDPGR